MSLWELKITLGSPCVHCHKTLKEEGGLDRGDCNQPWIMEDYLRMSYNHKSDMEGNLSLSAHKKCYW